MGTRADFYVGTGPDSEWIGSITLDGYPDGTPEPVLKATSAFGFRSQVEKILADPKITSTRPSEGWPWPWKDSRTTDYAYAWVDGAVMLSRYGSRWESLDDYHRRIRNDEERPKMTNAEVKDMSAMKMDAAGIMAKSGMIIVRGR